MSLWLGFTNHKLYQTRLLMQQVEQAQPEALALALEASALYHLHDAYVCYLNELAEAVQHPSRVDSLAGLLQQVSLATGEMTELKALEQDSFSWLNAFLQAVDDRLQAAMPANLPVSDVARDSSLIAVHQQSGGEVFQWYQQLVDVIERQRENRQES